MIIIYYFLIDGAAQFNGDISKWDTSFVTDMAGMFAKAYAFDGDLALWNTSKVTSMAYMFNEAQKFSGNISMWDISAVIDMTGMFYAAGAFNHDLCVWGNGSFPYTSATDIFSASGCTFQDDPELTQNGPFCASECNGQ
jgi:surface protein